MSKLVCPNGCEAGIHYPPTRISAMFAVLVRDIGKLTKDDGCMMPLCAVCDAEAIHEPEADDQCCTEETACPTHAIEAAGEMSEPEED